MRVNLWSDGTVNVLQPDATQFDGKYVKGFSSGKDSLKFWGILILATGQKILVKFPDRLKT